MAKHFKPRRGRVSVLAERNPLLLEGELIFECPDTGVGTGVVKVKIGDGVHQYNDLPYAIKDTVVEEVAVLVETPTKEDGSAYTTKAEYMGIIASNQKVKHILGAIKKCLEMTDTTLTELNNKIKSLTTTVNGKANSSHTHDDRYFTESEINTKLNSYLTTSKAGTQVTFSLSGTTLTITPK